MNTHRRRPPPILGLAAAIATGLASDDARSARRTASPAESAPRTNRPTSDDTPTPPPETNRPFTISGLRAIERAHVDHLARITVFVGRNASGKTTMLEALRIHASGGDPATLRHMLGPEHDVPSLFHQHAFRRATTATVTLRSNDHEEKRISLLRPAAATAHHVQVHHDDDVLATVDLHHDNRTDPHWQWIRPHVWIDRAGARAAAESRWNQITSNHRRTGPTGTLILVDELENGLHHTDLKRRWCDTLRYAAAHQAGLATTTQSLECLHALAAASANQGFDDIRVIRLEPHDRRARTVAYDAEALRDAARRGTELR